MKVGHGVSLARAQLTRRLIGPQKLEFVGSAAPSWATSTFAVRFRPPNTLVGPVALSLLVLMMAFPTEAGAVRGRQVDGACDWPTTVGLVNGRGLPTCSGTLIHPSLVVTAARCLLEAPQSVSFGENATFPDGEVAIAGCVDNLAFFGDERIDLAVCQLAEPVEGVPIVPLLMGCETEVLSHGTPTVIVGYGNSVTSDTLGHTGFGPKRFGELQVELVREDTAEVDLYDNLDGVCHRDWGGSAFVQLPDGSWRLFGAAKSIVYPQGHVIEPGYGNQCGNGAISRYTLLSPLVEWMESETQADLTPCFDSGGQWDPDDRCASFPIDIDAVPSTWAESCVGALGGEPTCGDLDGESDSDSGEGTSSTSGTTGDPGNTSESGPHHDDGSSSGAPEDTSTGPQTSSGSTTAPGAGGVAGTEPNGCGCQTPAGPAPWSLAALLLVTLRRREAQRCAIVRSQRGRAAIS